MSLSAFLLLVTMPFFSDVKQGSLFLDKDHLISSLPKMNERPCKNPSEAEFQRVIQEFWFEAYHVAICLKQQDLWAAKFRSSALQGFLLQMLEWKAQTKSEHFPPPNGKRMASWVDSNTWQSLHGVFAHFDAEDSWKVLFHTLSLFRDLSIDVAQQIGTNYPEPLDKDISNYIASL